MRSFQAPESFVIKSEKIFDLFQFFFLNVGVDVIEIKDALFSPRFASSLASLRSPHFSSKSNFIVIYSISFANHFVMSFDDQLTHSPALIQEEKLNVSIQSSNSIRVKISKSHLG